ncbi:MAG: response regulator transcription factor [Muribaculaceae bacterium]|nr:response regulator transcription factor [Muribaculaceae bacterium]
MKTFKIIVAETAPIILFGLMSSLKKFKEGNISGIEVDSKELLFETISSEEIDLLIVNPTFGGLLHPDEVRKSSLNPDIKIFAIEISKLNKATLSLYDDHIHVTDLLNEIREKVNSALNLRETEIEEKESLSQREKEIVSLVVKGLTNQEIADKLFLSVHTVMTHRRNIARKLQIHSATGLTIYAIVNKIVDLSEIKLNELRNNLD